MPEPKEYITAEELRAKEDTYLRGRLGYTNQQIRSMTEAERASKPFVQELRSYYGIKPTSETAGAIDQAEAKETRAEAKAEGREDYYGLIRVEPPVDTTDDVSTGLYPTTINYDPVGFYTTATPIETTTTYKPARAGSVGNSFWDAFGRQVSVPYGSVSYEPAKPDVEDEIAAVTMESGKQQQFWDDVARVAADELRAKLTEQDPSFVELPLEEQRKIIFSVINGINYAPTIKTDTSGYEPTVDWNPVPRNVEQGDIPDYTPEQSVYLKAYRAEATKRKATALEASGMTIEAARAAAIDYVNNAIGKPQWWEDPNLKAQRLAADPDFNTVMGFGTIEYPSGATVESTPSYALRIFMSPANMVTGMIGGALGAMDADIQAVRESSDITPVMVQNDPTLTTWEKSVRAGLDNVKRNRGATEEIYDLGIATGVDQYIGKPALFAGALLADVIAVPVVPGAGLVGGAIKGGAEATKVAKAAGKAVKATDILLEATKGALKAEPITDYMLWAGKKVGLLDAPNDIRLIAADRLATAAKAASTAAPDAAAALYGAMPKAFRAISEDITKLTEEISTKGLSAVLDASAYTSKDVARWAQMAIKSNGVLADLVRSADSVPAVVKLLAESPDGLKALRAAALEEAAVKYIVDATKDMGPGSLYLLTAKTAVPNSKIANAIIDSAKSSDVGKAITETIKEGKVTDAGSELAMKTGAVTDEATGVTKTIGGETAGTVGRDATSWIEVSEANASTLTRYLSRRLAIVSDVEKPLIHTMLSNLAYDNNKLTIRQLNQIQEMLLDDIARAKYTTKSLSEGAINRMAPNVIEQLTKAQPLRDGYLYTLMKSKAKEWTNKGGVIPHPNMQKAFNDIQQSVSALPDTVIFRIRELRNNIEIAKQYDLSKLPASNKEALFTMVFKPKGSLAASDVTEYMGEIEHHIRNVVKTIDSLIFYPKGGTVLGDFFKPVRIASEEADAFSALSRNAKTALADESERLITEIEQIAQRSDPSNLLLIQKSLEAYLDNVSTILKGSGLSVISKEKVMDLIQSAYFDLEAKAIAKNRIATVLEETGKIESAVGDIEQTAYKVFLTGTDTNTNEARMISANVKRMIITRAINIMETATGEARRNIFAGLMDMRFGDNAYDVVVKNYISGTIKLIEDVRAGDPDAWRLLEAIDDAALQMLEANRLVSKDLTKAIDELQNILQATSKGSLDAADSALKNTILEQGKTVNDSFMSELIKSLGDTTLSTDKLKAALRDSANANNPGFWDYVRNVLDLKKIQYFFMLTIRTRFHGMNLLTAPFIMGSTIGGAATLKALPSMLSMQGLYVASRALFPLTEDISLLAKDAQIAFTTTNGKAYTWREIVDIIQRSGIVRTDAGLENVKQGLKNVAFHMESPFTAGYEGVYKAGQISYDAINSIAPLSDLSWRASVLIQSLKAGETELTAVNKAREALFDYGKMTEFEAKYINNYLAFYSFLRASAGNALWNILNNPSRIANQIKATKRGPALLTNDEYNNSSLFYEPEYAQYRPLISIKKGVDKQSYGTYLPMLPLIDSFILLAKVISIPVNFATGQPVEMSLGDFAMERSNPTLQAIFSKRLEETYGSGRIDPRHVAVLKATGQWDLFKKIIGEPVEVPAKPGEAAWVTDANDVDKTYRFEDEGSIRRYINLLRWISFVGGDTWIKDYAPLVGAEPVESSIELETSRWELLGLTTDMKHQEPNEVINRKIQDRTAELNKRKADK